MIRWMTDVLVLVALTVLCLATESSAQDSPRQQPMTIQVTPGPGGATQIRIGEPESTQPLSPQATRIQEFQRSRYQKSGREYARPVEQVIDELLKSDDRPTLAMLREVLSTKTLPESQIQRLIEAAKKDASDAHRFCLWQVLFLSQSEAAGRYLDTALKSAADATVFGFVSSLSKFRPENVDLLIQIYDGHKNERIRDAVLELANRQNYSGEFDEQTQQQLLKWIVLHEEDASRKLAALRTAYQRAGVNTQGRNLVQEALEREKSVEVRKAIYKMMLARDEEQITQLLTGTETPEVKLAGLAAYASSIRKENRPVMMRERQMPALRQAAEKDASPEVRAAAAEIFGTLREAAVQQSIQRYQYRGATVRRMLDTLDSHPDRLPPDMRDPQRLRRMLEQRGLGASDVLRQLENQYGPLPNRKAILEEIEKSDKEADELTQQLLKKLPAAPVVKPKSETPARKT